MGPEIRFQNRGRKLLQELRIFDYIIRKYALIPKDILGNKEYSWINMMALWELTIPYSAARLSKMEVHGNDTVFLIDANRKSLEPLLHVFGLVEKQQEKPAVSK